MDTSVASTSTLLLNHPIEQRERLWQQSRYQCTLLDHVVPHRVLGRHHAKDDSSHTCAVCLSKHDEHHQAKLDLVLVHYKKWSPGHAAR
jgi:hypothetical protein